MSTPRTLLLYPPLTDPTSPYHSLVYAATPAAHEGFPIEIRDLNIAVLNFCARPEVLNDILEGWRRTQRTLESKHALGRFEQLQYSEALRTAALEPEHAIDAIAVMRDRDSFYDYPRYRAAARTLQQFISALAPPILPAIFGGNFALQNSLLSASAIRDLTDNVLLEGAASMLRRYWDAILSPDLRCNPPEIVGIGITYTTQLPFARWLAARVREALPDAYLVCGGTEVTGLWKYAKGREAFDRVLEPFDACIIGEGESALLALLEAIARGERPGNAPNRVVLRSGSHDVPIHYENIDRLDSPDYALLADEEYWSPERLLYYSPTRGCYWNQCTFCDYGLNFGTPTSPWRQRSLERVSDDLRTIQEHASYAYLSVDVLSPAALLRMAEEMLQRGIHLRWSAEMRLERYFTPARCQVLRDSGCVAVSVGFESAAPRILEGIRKGTSPEQIAVAAKNLTAAGIAVQMMGFTGFPGETFADAAESVRFLEVHRSDWTAAGVGEFVLTPGAIIAQSPSTFGIAEQRRAIGDDVGRALWFREETPPKNAEERAELERRKHEAFSTELDRPFAGGIDSAHSIFYYGRFGLSFRPMARRREIQVYGEVIPNGMLLPHVPFDALSLFDREDLSSLCLDAFSRGVHLDHEAVLEHLRKHGMPLAPTELRNPCFVRSDGFIVPCSREMMNILETAAGGADVSLLRDLHSDKLAEQMLDLLLDLELLTPRELRYPATRYCAR